MSQKLKEKQPTININSLGIYKAAIPISMGFTIVTSIFSMANLGLFDFSSTQLIHDTFGINVMFFSSMAIFSSFILLVFLNLNKVVKLKEKEIHEKNREIIKVERLSAIGEISARIAHDMRNPISTMKNALELLIFKNNGDVIKISKKELAVLQRAISRMSHQVEDVLDFVKEQPIEKQFVNLQDLITTSISSVRNPNNVKIVYPKNQTWIKCDAVQLERVFINLVVNALQSIGPKGEIQIRIKEASLNSEIEFIDSGPGIPQEISTEIMEPLFTTKQEGTGLGLASCHRIVKQHGGSISFKNNPTTFTVNLPKK